MTGQSPAPRFSKLAPLPALERARLSSVAFRFFSPGSYKESCAFLGKTPDPTAIRPFSGYDFVQYLERTGELPDANRWLFRIRELLEQLASAHLLFEVGQDANPIFGTCYYFMREPTDQERKSLLWLAPALGPEFIYYSYGPSVFQIAGINSKGDARAGTGLVLSPAWLLTCAHVVNGMKVNQFQTFAGKQYEVKRSLAHPDVDVAILEITPLLTPLRGLAFRDPTPGEQVFTLGYPRVPVSKVPPLVIHRGEVTAPSVRTYDGRELFLFSAIARPGNSGGPLISISGNPVGIVSDDLWEEQLLDEDETAPLFHPFYAGVRGSDVARAVAELEPSLLVPMETYE